MNLKAGVDQPCRWTEESKLLGLYIYSLPLKQL
jgi:hypothetical protein